MSMPSNPLTLDSLTLLKTWFTQQWPSVDQRYVTISVDAINSQLVVASLDVGTDGTPGIYGGTGHLPYTKVDLSQTVVYPMTYDGPWPTTYRLFKAYMQTRYGFVFEQSEFTIPGNTTQTPLVDADTLDAAPDANTGEILLVAAASAARWQTNSQLPVIIAPSNGPARLPALVDTNRVASLQWLTDKGATVDATALSIFLKLVGWWDWSTGDYSDRHHGWETTAIIAPAADGGQPVGQIVPGFNGKGLAFQTRYTPAVNGFRGGEAWSGGGTGGLNVDDVCGSEMSIVGWFKSTDYLYAPLFGRGLVLSSGAIDPSATFGLYLGTRLGGVGHVQMTYPAMNSGGQMNGYYLFSAKAVDFHDGNWHYAGIQIDGASADLYTEGTLDQTASMAGMTFVSLNDYYPSLRQSLVMWASLDSSFSTYGSSTFSVTALFKKKLTPQEHAWLYNSGQGRSYDDLVAAAGV